MPLCHQQNPLKKIWMGKRRGEGAYMWWEGECYRFLKGWSVSFYLLLSPYSWLWHLKTSFKRGRGLRRKEEGNTISIIMVFAAETTGSALITRAITLHWGDWSYYLLFIVFFHSGSQGQLSSYPNHKPSKGGTTLLLQNDTLLNSLWRQSLTPSSPVGLCEQRLLPLIGSVWSVL